MRLALALALVVAGSATAQSVPQHRRFMQPAAKKRVASTAATASYSLCAQLAAGDKVGNWGCINGDMTSASGAAITFAGVGSPVVSGGTTCASPKRAAFTSSARAESTVTTFPTGAYSICGYFDLTSPTYPYGMWSFGNDANGYAMTQESPDSNGWTQYDSTVHSYSSSTPAAPGFVCLTSSALLVVTVYKNGVQAGATPTFVYVDPGNSRWRFGWDSLGSGYRYTGPFLGGFVTEKELSAADVARLYSAVTCQ